MHVLVVGPVPPPLGSRNPGGVAHHTWDLATALSGEEHDVEVLATGRYCRRTRKVDGITVWGVAFCLQGLFAALKSVRTMNVCSSNWSLWERSYLLYTLYRLASLPDLEQYDVVHAQGITHKAPVAWRGLGLEAPVVLTVHSYSQVTFADLSDRQRLVRHATEVYRDADLLIHVSETDRRKGLGYGVLWSCPDRIVHHGLASAEDSRLGDAGRSGVCFVGTLSERKGLASLLDAWTRVSTEATGPLRIAGDGPLATEVADFAERHPAVEYVGYLGRDQLHALLGSSWVLVVPSRSESFGLAYAEALTRGTAVVGYSEILEEFTEVLDCTETEAQLLMPVDIGSVDRDELADLIEHAARERRADGMSEVASRLARKARKYFSWDREVKQIEDAYCQVVG